MRHAIEIKEEIVKKRVKGGKILPEHEVPETVAEKELEDMKVGPGKYDASFKLVE